MSCAADLGGSSNYSFSKYEDRGGMGSMRTSIGHGLAVHETHG
jgi:hypothetical protein